MILQLHRCKCGEAAGQGVLRLSTNDGGESCQMDRRVGSFSWIMRG